MGGDLIKTCAKEERSGLPQQPGGCFHFRGVDLSEPEQWFTANPDFRQLTETLQRNLLRLFGRVFGSGGYS